MNKIQLKEKVVRSLRKQGFSVRSGLLLPPESHDKEFIRGLHALAVQHRINEACPSLAPIEEKLLTYVANGNEVTPDTISPVLVPVESGTFESDLFRYAGLHWSIPLSSGYGRRLRFLVMDSSNNKLIGIIGLADPVFALRPRDEWIGWTHEDRRKRLQNVMEAFVLGAVPPYSLLLCGKLVAMLVTSNEVRQAFRRKYRGMQAYISGREHDGNLALITTTSALGRSSIYNRLRFQNRSLYIPVGYTAGSGDFHFTNGLYGDISKYVKRYCEPTAKHEQWGTGFRNRREVIRKCLPRIGLSSALAWHGIHREVFMIPLVDNCREFLRGEHTNPRWRYQSADELSEFFLDRWLLPRATREDSYKYFEAKTYRLWK